MGAFSRTVWPLAVLFILFSICQGTSQNGAKNGSSTERVDINKTITEVEKILDKYPELPRIERSEILSIIQNITEEDNERLKVELTGVLEEEKQKIKASGEIGLPPSKKDKKKSVMVVMPFKPDEEQDSLEELFTRKPIVRMEEQKTPRTTTYSPPTTSTAPSTSPPYSIVEKEDTKFNPPLRVIGFRYHTTPAPDSPKTYTNFQSPEQVTKAFSSQEFVPSSGWNHQTLETTTPGPVWPGPFSMKPEFHVPDSVDNFSLEDAMIQNMEQESEPEEERITERTNEKVTPEPLEEFFTSTSSTTTTTAKTTTTTTTERIVPTTTEKVTTTTKKPTKKKQKPKPKQPEIVTPTKDMSGALDTLPPHLKAMLSTLGVSKNSADNFLAVPSELPKKENSDFLSLPPEFPIRGTNAKIDPKSYAAFKPIPSKKQKTITDDMQEFLASFGLLTGHRDQKAMEEPTTTKPFNDKYLEGTPEINADILTDSMKLTLETLGLFEPSRKTSNKKNHIFSPRNHSGVQSDEEVKKLNALLTTIKKLASLNESEPVTPEFQNEILRQVKELDNITISYKTSEAINEEIHKIMDKKRGKFKIPIVLKESSTLQEGPDPQFYEDIMLKNEVKRQENGTSTTEGTTEATTTTTTEPANSADLEDAFGGGDTAPAGSNPSESLPPKRPNGLYLLLDWNTFFEVGTEDDARRVNIRFQPKIGDGRNFLPVSIP